MTNRTSVAAIFLFCIALAAYGNLDQLLDAPQLRWLIPPIGASWSHSTLSGRGVEYYFIAESIMDRGEFGSPFGGDTGPTAWMPPMWCWLQVAFRFFLDSDSVGYLCFGIQILLVAAISAVSFKFIAASLQCDRCTLI